MALSLLKLRRSECFGVQMFIGFAMISQDGGQLFGCVEETLKTLLVVVRNAFAALKRLHQLGHRP